MRRKLLPLVATLALLSGCMTDRGRFIGLEFDFRDPEQLSAYRDDLFGERETREPAVQQQAIPLTVWQSIAKILPSLKFRIRLAVIEFDKGRRTK